MDQTKGIQHWTLNFLQQLDQLRSVNLNADRHAAAVSALAL